MWLLFADLLHAGWTASQSVAQVSVAQAVPTDVSGGLLQYGALGILVLIALYAVVKLFARQVAAMDKETARADRLELELREQNRIIQDRLVVELTKATEAIAALPAILARDKDRR